MELAVSLLGVVAIVGLAWLMSSQKRRLNLRLIVGGLLLQFVFALIVLKTLPGQAFFEALGKLVTRLLGFVDRGSQFVFGDRFGEFEIAFKVLPTIIFSRR